LLKLQPLFVAVEDLFNK